MLPRIVGSAEGARAGVVQIWTAPALASQGVMGKAIGGPVSSEKSWRVQDPPFARLFPPLSQAELVYSLRVMTRGRFKVSALCK